MRTLTTCAVFFLLMGCDSSNIKQAKDMVRAMAKDPDSVEFRHIHETPDGSICGEWNGKNSYGALAGFTRFGYKSGVVYLDKGETITAETLQQRNLSIAELDQMASNSEALAKIYRSCAESVDK